MLGWASSTTLSSNSRGSGRSARLVIINYYRPWSRSFSPHDVFSHRGLPLADHVWSVVLRRTVCQLISNYPQFTVVLRMRTWRSADGSVAPRSGVAVARTTRQPTLHQLIYCTSCSPAAFS